MLVSNPRAPRSDVAVMGPWSQQLPVEKGVGSEQRSSYSSVSGNEFPPAVYRTIVFAFAWMMLAAWLAFGAATGTDLDLAIATVLCTVFLAIPIIMYRTARKWVQRPHQVSKQFLKSQMDIATGRISGREAFAAGIIDTGRACSCGNVNRRRVRCHELRKVRAAASPGPRVC